MKTFISALVLHKKGDIRTIIQKITLMAVNACFIAKTDKGTDFLLLPTFRKDNHKGQTVSDDFSQAL